MRANYADFSNGGGIAVSDVCLTGNVIKIDPTTVLGLYVTLGAQDHSVHVLIFQSAKQIIHFLGGILIQGFNAPARKYLVCMVMMFMVMVMVVMASAIAMLMMLMMVMLMVVVMIMMMVMMLVVIMMLLVFTSAITMLVIMVMLVIMIMMMLMVVMTANGTSLVVLYKLLQLFL